MSIDLHLFDGGHCTHLERMAIRSGRFCKAKFPAMFALIIHPRLGPILYDTAYSNRFFKETRAFPKSIYAKMTPVFINDQDTAISKLKNFGLSPGDIKYILISHFHADHIGALKDFPKAHFICYGEAYESIKNKKGLSALIKGFLPGLLPTDFDQRVFYIDENKNKSVKPPLFLAKHFSCHSLFGDDSFFAVKLPGHAPGQMGLYIETQQGPFFLIADSCWMSESYKKKCPPSRLSRLINHHQKSYYQTLSSLHEIYKGPDKIQIIPSHCGQKFLEHVKKTHIEPSQLNGVRH
ncbi:MBL fold metallo-hydrolase [Bacteriovoracales bacterium]|nr:MBL fold metallo-hydrolase [Bacteriovoracales bacterium]